MSAENSTPQTVPASDQAASAPPPQEGTSQTPDTQSGAVHRSESRSSVVLPIAARWVLAAAFIYMGMHKVLAPAEFLGLVRQYNLTNNYIILNCIAAALPWFEVFCGLLLLFGIA